MNTYNQAIQVKGLQKSYEQLHVLKGWILRWKKGSIFALLGSNGAGKTKIVKILTTCRDQNAEPLVISLTLHPSFAFQPISIAEKGKH